MIYVLIVERFTQYIFFNVLVFFFVGNYIYINNHRLIQRKTAMNKSSISDK